MMALAGSSSRHLIFGSASLVQLAPCPLFRSLHLTESLERARQATRLRKRKEALRNKRKKEERLKKEPPPIPYKVQLMLKSKGLWGPPKPLREKDDDKSFCADNVYLINQHAWKRYTLEEAIVRLRQHYHPTILDNSQGLVYAKIEFDLRASKQGRYMDGFSKMVPIIHAYDRGVLDRTVCAFVPEDGVVQREAVEAGAFKVGGESLIQEISKGRVDIADIDYFVAHHEMASSIGILTSMLREKMPKTSQGTIGSDIGMLVKTFGRGMNVIVEKIKPTLGIADEPDYGVCEVTLGRLHMDVKEIGDNLTAVLEKVLENRPKRKENDSDDFVTRCILKMEGNTNIGEDLFSQFTITHELLDDHRLEEQSRVVAEGKEMISRKVSELKLR